MRMLAATIGLWAFYCLACVCLGALLQRLIAFRSEKLTVTPGFARLSTAFLIGQGGLANLWLLLALGARFSPFVVVSLLVIFILAGCYFARLDVKSFITQLRNSLSAFRAEGWLWKGLVLLSLLVLVIKGIGALLPPDNIDAISFYLALPKAIAASHRLLPLPGYEIFTQVGLQGELHHAALMSLGSAQAAKLFVWSNSIAIVLLLSAIGKTVGLGRRGQIIALVMLVTSTAFTFITADGKVDLFGAAMGMAAFYWALQVKEGSLALRLTGLFVGLAVIAKMSYLPVLVPAILLIVFWELAFSDANRARLTNPSLLILPLAVLGFWMTLPVVPHLIKNALLFHQPLAPFVAVQGQAVFDQKWFAPEITKRIVLTYPLALVFGQYPMQYGNLSPLVMAFAPLVLKLPRPRSLVRNRLVQLTVATLVGVGIWVMLRPSVLAPRYILAPLIALIPLAAYSAEYVERSEAKPRLLSAGILICLCFMMFSTLNQVRAIPGTTLRYLTGRVSDCDIAGAECSALSEANREAQAGERVFLGAYYRYWLRPDLLQCVSTTDEQNALGQFQTKEERWEYLVDRGFRYLVIDQSTHAQTKAMLGIEQAPGWLNVVPLMRQGNFVVYRIVSREPARQPHFGCVQTPAPAWQVVAR